MLRGVVEFDVGGPGEFEPAKFVKRKLQSKGIERFRWS